MSGGVDSSVAAYLLQQQGYDVIGISLKTWDADEGAVKRGKTCCSFQDIEDARQVCARLNIPFYAFNYQKVFREKVIGNFVSEYLKGRTPNPCIQCNNHIKFEQLLGEAEKLGADFLATGHHARIERDAQGAHLLKGKDENKDQSYVLYGLSQEQLSKVLLPVGDYTKEEIRQMAEENAVPTAQKPESQDICFIPNRDHASFIQKQLGELPATKGNFVDAKGEKLGTHDGIHAFTVGQRRGLGIGFGDRRYVTGIDATSGNVTLGDKTNLLSGGLIATRVNWIHPVLEGSEKIECGVKIRYQKDEIPAVVEAGENANEVVVKFKVPAGTVSPGQSAVFYRGDEALGGGIIEKALT